jgi:hypothetical protein
MCIWSVFANLFFLQKNGKMTWVCVHSGQAEHGALCSAQAGTLARGARRVSRVRACRGGRRRCHSRSVLPLVEKIMVLEKIYIKNNDFMLEKYYTLFWKKIIDSRQLKDLYITIVGC